jgi:8-oxo-dGTP pyrophosphatase MutT (NUDIX family)
MNSLYQNPWTIVREDEKYDNPWIRVNEFQVINPAGNPGIYGKIHFKNFAIGIIPITKNDEIILVGQWRFPLNQYSWEIPEGGGPLNIDPVLSAKRELLEETGLVAATWTKLMDIHTSNSVCDEIGYVFLAENLEQHDPEPEETEDLQLKKIPFQQAFQMVMDGEITDSISVAAILKYQCMRLSK